MRSVPDGSHHELMHCASQSDTPPSSANQIAPGPKTNALEQHLPPSIRPTVPSLVRESRRLEPKQPVGTNDDVLLDELNLLAPGRRSRSVDPVQKHAHEIAMADAVLAGRDGLPELGTLNGSVLLATTRRRCPSLGLRRPGTQELVWPVDGVLLDEGEPLGLGCRAGLVEAVDEDA